MTWHVTWGKVHSLSKCLPSAFYVDVVSSVQIHTLSVISSAILGKLLNIPVAQFPHLANMIIVVPSFQDCCENEIRLYMQST